MPTPAWPGSQTRRITAYTVALLGWRTGGRIDFDLVWERQSASQELSSMLDGWVGAVDAELRRTAGARMPSEWAKKPECWEAIRSVTVDVPDPLPAEMRTQLAGTQVDEKRRPSRGNGNLTRDDLDMIDRARAIDAATWLRVAGWGTKSKAIHWKLSGIAKTMGEYALGGWERSPSAKQAKWALEAHQAAEKAGAFGQSKDVA